MKKILVIVDMQNDFVNGALGTKEAEAILPAVRERAEEFRAAGGEVVFTRDTHGENYLSTQEGRRLPVPHCIRGTHGWELAEGLYRDGEKIFDKPSFGSVELAAYIRDGKYDEAEFVGVCTDICVVSNVLLAKAYAPEMPIRVRVSCCAGTSPEAHADAVDTMRSCQAEIV